jgi:hypothetical protein
MLLITSVDGFQVIPRDYENLAAVHCMPAEARAREASSDLPPSLQPATPCLIVGGGLKVYGEASGKGKIEGRAEQSAKEIASVLKQRFQEQGWIQ